MREKDSSPPTKATTFGGEHRASPPGYRLGVAIAAGTLLVFLLRYFGAS